MQCEVLEEEVENRNASSSTNRLFSSPGFARLKDIEKCGKVVHTASLCSQRSVLLICLFLLIRVA